MVIQLMMQMAEWMSKEEVIKVMKEAIVKFENNESAENDLTFAAILITMKLRPDKESAAESIKRYEEMSDWLKMKPKGN